MKPREIEQDDQAQKDDQHQDQRSKRRKRIDAFLMHARAAQAERDKREQEERRLAEARAEQEFSLILGGK